MTVRGKFPENEAGTAGILQYRPQSAFANIFRFDLFHTITIFQDSRLATATSEQIDCPAAVV